MISPRSLSCIVAFLASMTWTQIGVRADSLVADLSENAIRISSNFTGQQLVLFGAIDRTSAALTGTPGADGIRDVVVVVRGPERPVTVRRKERVFGIWANTESVEFQGVPGYYFIATNRPFDDLAGPRLYRRYQLRPQNLRMNPKSQLLEMEELDEFKDAIIRIKKDQDLFYENPGEVRFLDQTLFRTTVTIPANVPVGLYKAEVYLIRDGQVISVQSKTLEIDKTGFERTIYQFAYDSPLVYGVLAVLIALAAGWLASVAFARR